MRNKKWHFGLIALLFIHVLSNTIWLWLNNAPPTWDPASHTWISLDIAEKLKNFDFAGMLKSSNYYPIFVHALTAVFMLILGPNIKFAQFLGTIFFAIAIASLYFYTLIVYKNSRLAFFSAAIFSFFPIVFDQSRRLMLDIPSVALLLLSLFLLEKSNFLRDTKTSIFFFITSGLLIMTKWTGAIYLLIPAFFILLNIYKNKDRKTVLKNIALGVPLFLLITTPWYWHNFSSLFYLTKINSIGYADQPLSLFCLQNFLYYLNLFVNQQVTPITAIIFFISFTYLIFSKNRNKWFLFFMIIANYLFFTFINNKDQRYTMPILPFAAIIIALFLEKMIKSNKKTGVSLGLFFLILLFSYFFLLTARPTPFEGLKYHITTPLAITLSIININDSLAEKYKPLRWTIDDVLHDAYKTNNNQTTKIEVLIEDPYFNPSTLQTYLKASKMKKQLRNMKLQTPDITLIIQTYNKPYFPDAKAIQNYLMESEYVLISPLNLGTQYLRNKKALWQLQSYLLSDKTLACNRFTEKIAPSNTTCIVREGEILESGSDLKINDDKILNGKNEIEGFAKVNCPWGCSFKKIKNTSLTLHPKMEIIKEYTLPNKTTVVLYKINPRQLYPISE